MGQKLTLAGLAALVLCLFASGAEAATTYFPLTDISGTGVWSSAGATVTTGPGYVDVLVQNTSPRQDNFEGGGLSANPFLTEVEINLDGYQPIAAGSYVQSLDTTLFAQGAGNPATQMGIRNLYYGLVAADSPGMHTCLMFGEGDILRNDNAIASLNALDLSNIPVEDYAVGFLNPSPYADSGAIFDAALFHFALDTTDTPDPDYWVAADTLVVKYQGGGDYSWHVYNVPEPTTVLLLGLGGLLLRRVRL